MRGRLIGPKSWDRIDMNFLNPRVAAVTATAGLGCQIVVLHNKSCIGLFEAENGRETRVHQVNR